jgi:hypothetical protein
VEVIEETMAGIIGLPQTREQWYRKINSQPDVPRQFLERGEALVNKGMGFYHQYLLHPWEDVAIFV